MPQSVLKGTAILFLGRISNRFLGLIREILSASLFGTGMAMDCFNLSFTMVTGVRKVFAEQFSTPVIPTFFRRQREGGDEATVRSLQSLTTRLFLFSFLISTGIFIWAKQIVQLIAPGFDIEKVQLSSTMLRWFAVGSISLILHLYITGIYTCFFRYYIIAFAPLLFNLFAILAMVFFAVKFGVVSLAAGYSLGFVTYVVFLLYFLPRRNDLLKLRWGHSDPGVSYFNRMIFPLFVAVSFEQLQLFVDRALASGLHEGALSAQGYALRLVQMLSNTVLGSFGTTIFPVFSSLVVKNQKDAFARNFSLAFQGAVLIMTFAGAVIIALALPAIRVLFERGAFTYDDSVQTSGLIVYYTVAYVSQVLFMVIVRGFHAHGDTRTPMFTTLISVAVMIAADFTLVGRMGIYGLALATAIGYTLNMILTYSLFTRHLTSAANLKNLKYAFLGLALSGVLGCILSQIWKLLVEMKIVTNFPTRISGIIVLSFFAAVIYFLVLSFLRVPALSFLVERIRRKKTQDRPSKPEAL